MNGTINATRKFRVRWNGQMLFITAFDNRSFSDGNIAHAKKTINEFSTIREIENFLFNDIIVKIEVA